MKLQIFLLAIAVVLVKSEPAEHCTTEKCLLEESCRCSTNVIPGGLQSEDIPQFVMLTFDDAITISNKPFYNELTKYKNPNGCSIGLTFFITHDYNDYTLTYDMWKKGHELASHSISHRSKINYWKNLTVQGWKDELGGMKDLLVRYAKIPRDDIQGVRAPFLQPGGNNQFDAMVDDDVRLSWDCSMSTRNQIDLWPFSLEYRSTMECMIPPCPDASYYDTWVIPMLDLFYMSDGSDGTEPAKQPCAMADTCVVNENEVYKLLMENFERNYKSNGNRAPFGVYIHAAWFQGEKVGQIRYEGYKRFIENLLQKQDVYFVTQSEVLNWVKNPENKEDYKASSSSKCLQKIREGYNNCPDKATCILKVGNEKRNMKICGQSYDCPNEVIPGGEN